MHLLLLAQVNIVKIHFTLVEVPPLHKESLPIPSKELPAHRCLLFSFLYFISYLCICFIKPTDTLFDAVLNVVSKTVKRKWRVQVCGEGHGSGQRSRK